MKMIGMWRRARVLLDERRRLEAVHARHLHVEQDEREVLLQDVAQRLLARARLTRSCPSGSRIASSASRFAGWSSTSRMLAGRVDAGRLRGDLRSRSFIAGTRPSSARSGGSRPQPDQLEQLGRVHRLGQVVGRAGLEALLAVVLQRLGGDGDDRQRRGTAGSRGWRASSRSRPSPGIITSISTTSMSGSGVEHLDAGLPFSA